MPDLKPLGDFISQVGFPVAVAIVLLWQVLHMHAENHRAIDKLTTAVEEMIEACRGRIRAASGEKHARFK